MALLVGLCEALCVACFLCPQHPFILCLLERNHNLCLHGRRPNIVVLLAFRVDLGSYDDTTQNLITSQAGLDGGLHKHCLHLRPPWRFVRPMTGTTMPPTFTSQATLTTRADSDVHYYYAAPAELRGNSIYSCCL